MSKRVYRSKQGRNNSFEYQRVIGVFSGHPRGFGFVDVKEEGSRAAKAIFVPRGSTGTALTGDLVAARVQKNGKRSGEMSYSGSVVEILERGKRHYVGTVTSRNKRFLVIPDGTKMSTSIEVLGPKKSGLVDGARVVIKIKSFSKHGAPQGIITEYLGMRGELKAETKAIKRLFDLPDRFPPKVLRQAEQVAREVSGIDDTKREDLTRLTTITIDPEDARDFDDAVSLSSGPNKSTVLGVHIADVSHFVSPRSVLDNEAAKRATSVYLTGGVVPMLPEILSNGVCSLVEGEKRLTMSVFLTYDANGELIATRFAETIIRSNARLTYKQAQEICDGKKKGFKPSVVKLVTRLRDLAVILEGRRNRAGMLHLDLPEVALKLDSHGRVVDAKERDNSFSHTMIEIFMVEANRAVATLFAELGINIIRRIHPAPNDESIEQLVTLVRSLNHKLPAKPKRRDLRELLEKVRGRSEEYPINLAVLRSLNQAKYSTALEGHYALSLGHYCHFTSPIRRYPDLTVHRHLSKYCRGKLREIQKREKSKSKQLEQVANNCSEAEHKAQNAENDLAKVLVLVHLAQKKDYAFSGIITGVNEAGIFVQTPKFLVEGFIRLPDLGNEWWDVSTEYGIVRGAQTGTTYHLGDTIDVCVSKIDLSLRHLDLKPVR